MWITFTVKKLTKLVATRPLNRDSFVLCATHPPLLRGFFFVSFFWGAEPALLMYFHMTIALLNNLAAIFRQFIFTIYLLFISPRKEAGVFPIPRGWSIGRKAPAFSNLPITHRNLQKDGPTIYLARSEIVCVYGAKFSVPYFTTQ